MACCAARDVTRPRPLGLVLFEPFELEAEADFFALALPDLELLALLLPEAKVFAALLREAAELLLEAMVFAARLLLAAELLVDLLVDLLLLVVGICISLLNLCSDFNGSIHSLGWRNAIIIVK